MRKLNPLTFIIPNGSSYLPCFTELLKKEDGVGVKNMTTLSTVYNPKRIPLAQFIYKTW